MAAPHEAVRPVCDGEADRAFAPLLDCKLIALAVSGGPDSLALLDLIARWRERTPGAPDCLVLTLDHGLRAEARAETRLVADTAGRRGLSCRVLFWEGEKPRSGLQAAARAARQRLFGEACLKAGAEALVLAHHLDDQAETVLLRLARGSGVFGLAAMRRTSIWPREGHLPLPVLRPLLGFSKSRLEATCHAAGLAFARDPSNADPAYARARLRMEMPHLARLGLTAERLAEVAGECAAAADALDGEIDRVLTEHATLHPSGLLALEAGALGELPPLTRERLLQRVLADLGSAAYPARRERLCRLLDRLGVGGAVPGGDERTQATLSGVVVRRAGERLLFWREPGRAGIGARIVAGPAEVVWDGRFLVTVEAGCRVEIISRAGLLARANGESARTRAIRDRLADEASRRPAGFPVAALAASPCVLRLGPQADGHASYCPGLSAGAGPEEVAIRPLVSWPAGQAAVFSGKLVGIPPESVEI